MVRRHAILVAVSVALLAALVAGLRGFDRVPELVVPGLVLYAFAFLATYRAAIGRTLGADVVAAAGLRQKSATRGWLARAVGHVLAVVVALCAVLAATAAALWARSHRLEDRLTSDRWTVLALTPSRWVRRFHDQAEIVSARGGLAYQRQHEVVIDPRFVLDKAKAPRPAPWHRFTWTGDSQPTAPSPTNPWMTVTGSKSRVLDALGIEFAHTASGPRLPGDPPDGYTWLVVPWRLITLALAAPPLCAAGVYLSRLRRVKPGVCVHCGYDLRATPGRCPECGRESVHPESRSQI